MYAMVTTTRPVSELAIFEGQMFFEAIFGRLSRGHPATMIASSRRTSRRSSRFPLGVKPEVFTCSRDPEPWHVGYRDRDTAPSSRRLELTMSRARFEPYREESVDDTDREPT
jgi:hypothetical protein